MLLPSPALQLLDVRQRRGLAIHLDDVGLRLDPADAVLAIRIGDHVRAVQHDQTHTRDAEFTRATGVVLHVVAVAVAIDLAHDAAFIAEDATAHGHLERRGVRHRDAETAWAQLMPSPCCEPAPRRT